MKIIDGKEVSNKIYEDLKKEISINNLKPCLAVIIVGERKDSLSYVNMKHKKSKTGKINIVGSPMNFSVSKIKYKKTPPTLGEDTKKFLNRFLKISIPEIKKLKDEGII